MALCCIAFKGYAVFAVLAVKVYLLIFYVRVKAVFIACKYKLLSLCGLFVRCRNFVGAGSA